MSDQFITIGTGHGGGAAPAWYAAAPSGQWVTMPGGTLQASGQLWDAANPPGQNLALVPSSTAANAVFIAWSSAVLNRTGISYDGTFLPGQFMCHWGGGHGDYGGNEIYTYGPIDSDSPVWRRITDPTIPPADDVPYTPDGYPCSPHTYDSIEWDPVRNRLFSAVKPHYYHAGNSSMTADYFDFTVPNPRTTKAWSRCADPDSNGTAGGICRLGVIVYDPTVDKFFFVVCGGGLQPLPCREYAPATNTWANRDGKTNPLFDDGSNGDPCADIDPVSRVACIVGGGKVRMWDLRNPDSDWYTPTLSTSIPNMGAGGVLWDPLNKRFVLKPDATTRALTFLQRPANPYAGGDTWQVTTVTPSAGATPTQMASGGIYKHFRFVGGTTPGYIYISDAFTPAMFYKL